MTNDCLVSPQTNVRLPREETSVISVREDRSHSFLCSRLGSDGICLDYRAEIYIDVARVTMSETGRSLPENSGPLCSIYGTVVSIQNLACVRYIGIMQLRVVKLNGNE